MAELTGVSSIFHGDTDVVDTSAQHAVGTRARDNAGNEYIYLPGASSVAAGTWVSFDEAGAVTRLVTNCVGRVGIAMAAISATTSYGWYQIYGKNTIALGTSGGIADNAQLYTASTNGVIDDTDAAGEMVIGAWSRSTDSSGVFTAELNYPIVINAAVD